MRTAASRFNPFVYAVDATRAAFVGNFTGWTVLLGILAAVGLSVAAVAFGIRTFQRENACPQLGYRGRYTSDRWSACSTRTMRFSSSTS